jgi:hypothetical protein
LEPNKTTERKQWASSFTPSAVMTTLCDLPSQPLVKFLPSPQMETSGKAGDKLDGDFEHLLYRAGTGGQRQTGSRGHFLPVTLASSRWKHRGAAIVQDLFFA